MVLNYIKSEKRIFFCLIVSAVLYIIAGLSLKVKVKLFGEKVLVGIVKFSTFFDRFPVFFYILYLFLFVLITLIFIKIFKNNKIARKLKDGEKLIPICKHQSRFIIIYLVVLFMISVLFLYVEEIFNGNLGLYDFMLELLWKINFVVYLVISILQFLKIRKFKNINITTVRFGRFRSKQI